MDQGADAYSRSPEQPEEAGGSIQYMCELGGKHSKLVLIPFSWK